MGGRLLRGGRGGEQQGKGKGKRAHGAIITNPHAASTARLVWRPRAPQMAGLRRESAPERLGEYVKMTQIGGPRWAALLLAGMALVLVAKFGLPFVTFTGRGGAVHEMGKFGVLPMMSWLGVAGVAAILAGVFLPALAKWRTEAIALGCLLIGGAGVAAWLNAVDAWSTVRPEMLQMAGTRTVKVNPGLGAFALTAGLVLTVIWATRAPRS